MLDCFGRVTALLTLTLSYLGRCLCTVACFSDAKCEITNKQHFSLKSFASVLVLSDLWECDLFWFTLFSDILVLVSYFSILSNPYLISTTNFHTFMSTLVWEALVVLFFWDSHMTPNISIRLMTKPPIETHTEHETCSKCMLTLAKTMLCRTLNLELFSSFIFIFTRVVTKLCYQGNNVTGTALSADLG